MGELNAGFEPRLGPSVIANMGLTTNIRTPALHRMHWLKCDMKLGGDVNQNGKVHIIDDVVFDVGL